MHQLIANLFTNAVEAIGDVTGALTIVIRVTARESGVARC